MRNSERTVILVPEEAGHWDAMDEPWERQRSIPWCRFHGSRENRLAVGRCEGSDIWTNNPKCDIVENVVWETINDG